MKKITKKDIKRIKNGSHEKLMNCLDFLLDSYNEDKFDLGYGACLDDMGVRSKKLAEYIHKECGGINQDILEVSVEKLANVIEEYFIDSLK